MINALNKPSDEKNYADAAAQFAYRAYGFSGDQYNYIVSSIDKQFMEIIKMEMMYQEFIAQRGDYFEEKYPDDESKWESYAAWTNDLNKLNEDVAKAMDTMLDREILVSDSTVGSIRMKLDEFVKPEDMVSVRMKNENYHEKLTGEFYENEQPIIDAFNEGYLYLIEEYGWKSNADVITPFINFHRIAVPTPKTEENPSGIDIYYIFDTSQPHDAEEDWAWNSDDSVPENLRFYQFEEKIDLTLARDQHIPSCDFINLTKENYSDGQNQFSCAKSTAEFQSLFATGLFSALSSIPGDYLSEYLLTKKDTKTYIALSDYDFDYHDAWATSYTIFHVVDTTGQYPGSSLESSTLSAEKIQPDKSAGAYSAYTVILKNRPQEDGYYKTKVDVATNGVGDTELENYLLGNQNDPKYVQHGWINFKTLSETTKKLMEKYDVRAVDEKQSIGSLSGGNQQKMVLSREVEKDSDFILVCQPVRGLDIGAINYIHEILLELRNQGKAILLISAELTDIFQLCDRIAVMYKGEVMALGKNEEFTNESIGLLMAGQRGVES